MMNKKILLISLCLLILSISACTQHGYGDLEEFVNNAGNGMQGQYDQFPAVKPYESFVYDAFELPSPFVPRKNEQVRSMGSDIQPDLTRKKELLESYPLESLSMVGTLQQSSEIFALIKSPEGALHRVRKGNYLGQDFGKIARITENEVILLEIVQDGVNDWSERLSTLLLKD